MSDKKTCSEIIESIANAYKRKMKYWNYYKSLEKEIFDLQKKKDQYMDLLVEVDAEISDTNDIIDNNQYTLTAGFKRMRNFDTEQNKAKRCPHVKKNGDQCKSFVTHFDGTACVFHSECANPKRSRKSMLEEGEGNLLP